MATLRRGLVDKVKKAAAKVSTRGVEVATKAGTRGARALVETTVAAVKTVDKLQEKLGRRSTKGRSAKERVADVTDNASKVASETATPKASTKAAGTTGRASTKASGTTDRVARQDTVKDVAPKKTPTAKSTDRMTTKSRGTTTETEAQPVVLREAGRKTMPGTAPKRAKAPAQKPGFKVKRGQKHRHTGR
ncbi:hypothetical protein [Hyalangium gracile]|uniref:hypothetical protein n=1 Tax=Hyalangium gracile TaxID=394092 RepID=UPI001CCB4035|nr:hypothetical protein [Hyalangium gracile]